MKNVFLIAVFALAVCGCQSQKRVRAFPRAKVALASSTAVTAKGVSDVTPVEPTYSGTVDVKPAQTVDWTKAPLVVILAAVQSDPTLIKAPEVVSAIVAAITKADITGMNPATLAELVKINVPDIQKALASMFSNIDVSKIPPSVLAEFVKANADAILYVSTNKSFRVKAPVLARAIAERPSAIETPEVFAALVTSATEAQAGDILAALMSAYNKIVAKNIDPAKTVAGAYNPKAWYETNFAPGGSHLWAIIRAAKYDAERGRDISKLHKAFIKAMNDWICEEPE